MTIYAHGGTGFSSLEDQGHTWLSVENKTSEVYDFHGYELKPGDTMTIGLWPDKTKDNVLRGYGGVFINVEQLGGVDDVAYYSVIVQKNKIEEIEAASPKESFYHDGKDDSTTDISDDLFHNCAAYAVMMWNKVVSFSDRIDLSGSGIIIFIPGEIAAKIDSIKQWKGLEAEHIKYDPPRKDWNEVFHLNKKGELIPLDKFSLSTNEITLNSSQTCTISASFERTPSPKEEITWKSSNERVAVVDNGVVRGIDEGSCKITASCGKSFKAECNVIVVKTDEAGSINEASVTGLSAKTYTGKAIAPVPTVTIGSTTLTPNIDYTVSYSNNTDVGTATVTITGVGNYNGTKTATFKINKANQSITAKTSALTITVGKTATVSITGAKGKKSYKSSNTAVAAVNASTGKVTAKKVGTFKITATSAGTANYNAASKVLTMKVLPKGTSITKISKGSRKFTVKWKKQTNQTTGYQIQYSSKKDFKTNKIVTVSGSRKTSKTVSSLAKKHKYYVRVRTYKTVGGTNYYSTWSGVKTVTTK